MRAVVVTGASSGIGEACAVAFARAGFVTYAGVRSDGDMRRLREAHENVRPLRLDVTDTAAIDAAVLEVRGGGVPLVGLVSNAGIAIGGPLECVPVDELRRQFEVNCFGAIAVTQGFLPLLRAQPSRVIFIGSISGRVAVPYIAPYSASKFALRAMSDALRVELAPSHIGVCLVEPGSVATAIWSKGRAMRDAMLARLGPDAPEYYRQAIEAIVRGADSEERGALGVEYVASVIVRTLTAPKARALRLIGMPARIGAILGLLPPRLHDRIMRATMRLP